MLAKLIALIDMNYGKMLDMASKNLLWLNLRNNNFFSRLMLKNVVILCHMYYAAWLLLFLFYLIVLELHTEGCPLSGVCNLTAFSVDDKEASACFRGTRFICRFVAFISQVSKVYSCRKPWNFHRALHMWLILLSALLQPGNWKILMETDKHV